MPNNEINNNQRDYLANVILMYALTPVHMGSGQSLSYVDLPVQREKSTSFPILWSSGIKGVLRNNFSKYIEIKYSNKEQNRSSLVDVIFGPEDSEESFASCISITDAKILFYPVRSLKGVFSYITCPFVINRFLSELSAFNQNLNLNLNDLQLDDDKIIVKANSILKINQSQVALEEFVFDINQSKFIDELFKDDLFEKLKEIVNDEKFYERVSIVSDNVFKDFVNYSVEIRTRIRIDQLSGVTKEGALFTQEFVPSQTVFYSFIFIKDSFSKDNKINKYEVNQKIDDFLKDYSILQFGSDETLGKGLFKLKKI